MVISSYCVKLGSQQTMSLTCVIQRFRLFFLANGFSFSSQCYHVLLNTPFRYTLSTTIYMKLEFALRI